MTDPGQTLAESHTAEAANASAVSKEADIKAQAAQIEAVVINAMRQVFGPLQVKSTSDQMHILLPKIPLLCLNVEKMGTDIKDLHIVLDEMNNTRVTKAEFAASTEYANTRLGNIEGNITWGVRIVIGAVLLALIGVVVKSQL